MKTMIRAFDIPSETLALQELSGLTAHLFHAFPTAAEERVLPYFRGPDREVNALLVAHMLRYEVRAYLKKLNCLIFDDEETCLTDLANSGIEGVYKNQWGFKVIRSSKDGGIPPVTDSRRRAFLSQQLRLFPFQQRPNAVLLWEPIDKSYTEFDLTLAIPKGVKPDGTVDLHYIVKVPWLSPLESPTPTLGGPREIDVRRKAPSKTPEEGVASQNDLR